MASPHFDHSLLHLRYKHLRLLVAIMDETTLHRAADALAMTQQSATYMLQQIEDAIKSGLLFKRTVTGMIPTELGTQTVRFARAALAQLEGYKESLRLGDGRFERLVFGAITSAMPNWIIPALNEIKIHKPLIQICIRSAGSDQVIALLQAHKADFAIARFSHIEQHNQLDFEPLGNEEELLVVRSNHPLAQETEISLAQLIEWPWVLQSLKNPARQLLENKFEQARVNTPRQMIEADSIFTVLQLVSHFDAIAVVSELLVRDKVQTGLLKALPITLGHHPSPFGVLTRQNEEIDHISVEFINILRKIKNKKAL